MNSENDSTKNPHLPDAIEIDEISSIDDFIKELEAKEKDLQLSVGGAPVLQIDSADIHNDELAELERFLDSFEKTSGIAADSAPVNFAAENNLENAKLKNELSALQDELVKAEKERAEIVESFRRRQSDFENFKKRIEREKSDTHRNILSGLATRMLPVVDNLTRAIESAENHETEKNPDFHQFVEGILMVNRQLSGVLESIGIEPIAAVGEAFDPHFHEAVATEENSEFPPNIITAELLRGYKIDGRVIRPAMVKVSAAKNVEQGFLELD